LRVFLFLLFLILSAVPAVRAQNVAVGTVRDWLDFSCIDFRIKGICIKHKHGRIKVGLRVSYYLPVAVVEVPPVPYRTSIAPLRPVLKASEPLVDRLVGQVPVLSSVGSYEFGGNTEGEEDTYYREVHIFTFPGLANPVLEVLPLVCGRPHFPVFVWFSEADPIDWRLGLKDYLHAAAGLSGKALKLARLLRNLSSSLSSPNFSLDAVLNKLRDSVRSFLKGLKDIKPSSSDWQEVFSKVQETADRVASAIPDAGWGSKTPHIGYVHDVSSTIAYHLMAVRALDLAFPLKPRWGVDKFQMVLPTRTGCYKLGSDRIRTETGKMVGGETPVWIYWYRYDCCVF